MRCIDSKRSNDMMYIEPNEKLHMLCNQVLWEVIYAYFYNWDGSLYLVLIVYGLVELIIETSHLTKDYLIVDIHTHHTFMFNECHIYLCDCNCLNVFSHVQSLLINHKKIFKCLVVFGKYFFFFFYKNCHNFKNSVALFWRLSHGLI